MPVTTRSKRKTVDSSDLQERPTKLLIKLIDITNKGKNSEKLDKSQVSSSKSADSVLYAKKQAKTDEIKVKTQVPSIRAHASCNSIQSQSLGTQSNSEDVLKVLRKVKQVLGNNFKSAASRLQLDIIPDCLFDLKKCHLNHSSKILARQASAENVFVAKLYITEERHFQFFQYIRRNLIASHLCPGTDICISIIKEIMKFKSKDPNLSTKFALSELHDIFITILNTFPPCHIHNSYLDIFMSKVKIDGLPEKQQLLPTVLDILHDLIYNDESDKFDKSISIDFNKNFYMWDMEHNENSAFTNLSRMDRFNRVFMVLDLMVRLLEYDTAVFVTKYSNEFASTIKQKGTKPIICSVIWQGFGDMMTVNATVKKIVSIFIAMNALNYPADKIRIVAKLLNLICNVINMYEHSENVVQYPVYKGLTLSLMNEIQKTIENSNYVSMDLWLKAIENLRSPIMRMLLTNQLYTKIVAQTLPVSLAVPFKAIYSKDFMKFDNVPDPALSENTELYPRHDSKKRSNKSKITQNHFIKLLMLYTDAVIRNFHLHEIVKELKNPEEQVDCADTEKKEQSSKFNLAQFEKQIKNIDLNEKVTLRSLDMHFRNMVHIRLSKENCSFYRNEIKNFSLIIKLIERCQEKYGSQFNEWMECLRKVQK